MFDRVAESLVNTICEHPTLVGVAVVVFVVCNLTVNGLRMAWPKEEERPRWVRFLLGFLDLGALNVWRLVGMLRPADPNPPLSGGRG